MRSRYSCRTNLDMNPGTMWPTEFVVCPRIGDRICATTDTGSGKARLKVVGITHTELKCHSTKAIYPHIIIELNN